MAMNQEETGQAIKMMINILLQGLTGEMVVALPGAIVAIEHQIPIPEEVAGVVLPVIKAVILPVTRVLLAAAATRVLRIIAVAVAPMNPQGVRSETVPASPHLAIPGVQIIAAGLPVDQHQEEINHPGRRIATQRIEPAGFVLCLFECLKLLL